MSKVLNIISHSESETLALGKKMAGLIPEDEVLVLTGELGCGKTIFVKGLAAGLGVAQANVQSPTFAFVHEYQGKRNLFHLDLYRLKNISELTEIGWDDYLSRPGLVAVEWGERAENLLPDRYYLIGFKMISDTDREINVSLVEP